MDPNHLRTFLAVAERLNYTRAAEELFLSQPAVSRQIRKLEQGLGVLLFEQIGKSLHLTDAGRTLAREADRILGSMERAAEVVRAHRSAERGRLRIGASTTPGLYLLPEVLGRFHSRFPDVELRYTVENSLRVEQKIIRNELDLGFVGARISNDDLRVEPVVDDEIVCFSSVSHPASRKRRIAPRSLGKEIWVVREKGSATRRLFESWLSDSGGEVGRMIELASPEAIKSLVASGIGLSCMSVHGIRDEIRAKRFRKLPVTGLRLKRPICLVRHADKHASPVMKAFLEIAGGIFCREKR